MIAGVVNADLEAIIRLKVRGPVGRPKKVEAVIDTGFDGCLSLPPALIASLRLPWRRRGCALLADGSQILFDVYEATVLWDGRSRRIPVDEADTTPLVGMALLKGSELNVQVRARGEVAFKPLP
jgi:clan AA aspartic protease